MIGLIDSWDVEYNGTENEALFKLVCDSAAELSSLTHYDNIKIRIGSECTDIATGDKYLKSSSAWVLQPSANAWENVYTKAQVDSMINTQYQTMLYYHTVQTSTTGTITFYAFEGFVGSLTIYGNGSQTGTPTPDNPVMATFCGVRTGNLLDYTTAESTANATASQISGGISVSGRYYVKFKTVQFTIGNTYTMSWKANTTSGTSAPAWRFHYSDNTYSSMPSSGGALIAEKEVTELLLYVSTSASCVVDFTEIMLNIGSTTLPYEPFGWAEKITCAGQTVPVYLGQTQTVRRVKKLVLDGEENWGYSTSENNARVYLAIDSMASSPSISTHYQFGTIRTYPILNEYCINNESDLIIGVDINSITSAADFKSYLAAQYAAGTPVTIWYVFSEAQTGITNEPLCKIDDYADILHLTDTLAPIPTVDGENTLTVDTTLPPSKIEISGER